MTIYSTITDTANNPGMMEETAVEESRTTFDAHENPYTLTTSPPEEPFKNHVVDTKPSPIILPVRSSNPTKLKLSYVQTKRI